MDGSGYGDLTFKVYDFEMGDGNVTLIAGSDAYPYYTKDLYVPNYITGTLEPSYAHLQGNPTEIECPTWGRDHILYVQDNGGADHLVFGYEPVVDSYAGIFDINIEPLPRHTESGNPGFLIDLGYCFKHACWGAYDPVDDQVEWQVYNGMMTEPAVRDAHDDSDTSIDDIVNATGIWVGGEETTLEFGEIWPVVNIVIEETYTEGSSEWTYALRCIQTAPYWVSDDIGGLEPIAIYAPTIGSGDWSSSLFLDESCRLHAMATVGLAGDIRTSFYVPNEQRYDSSFERWPEGERNGNNDDATLDWNKLHPHLRYAPPGV